MAVGIRLKFAGGTQEQYQAVHDTVNASSRSAGPTVCSFTQPARSTGAGA